MKIAVVFGTRPEIIKFSPLIRLLQKEKIDFIIINTNQHFSYSMAKIFLEQLQIPQAKYNLNINNIAYHGEMVGRMMIEIEKILLKEKPELVLVQGDTNTTLAGGLVAAKLQIKLGHIEAGLRSYDRTMPEEINRVVVDHLSDFLFAPTENQKKILLNEGIDANKIFVVGNTVVDAVWENIKIAETNQELVKKYKGKRYFFLTLHRPANVDDAQKLKTIIEAMEEASDIFKIPIIFPIHPRTKNNLDKFGIKIDRKKIQVVDPLGYFETLIIEKYATLLLTDSGGIQEEGCILQVPCITLRDNTERPETVAVGANILVGADKEKILTAIKQSLQKRPNWPNPFGNKVAEKILGVLKKIL
jgi:UDP-N-acetylglucosamine 2-epimerase (non-hydrolysing)